MAQRYKSVVVLEDGIRHGGIASTVSEMFRDASLQVRFVDAESGEVITGSGQGKAITTKTSSTLGDIEGPKFNKSTVGVSTKKALETSTVRVVEKLIKKGVFKN